MGDGSRGIDAGVLGPVCSVGRCFSGECTPVLWEDCDALEQLLLQTFLDASPEARIAWLTVLPSNVLLAVMDPESEGRLLSVLLASAVGRL